MIFTEEFLSFQVLDVFYLDQGDSENRTCGRNFDALSFRIEANTEIETKHQRFTLLGGSIGFFPSAVTYTRRSKEDRLIVVHFKLLNFQGNEIEYFCPKSPEKYGALFREMLTVWNRKESAYRYECTAILNRIFAEIYRENIREQPPNGRIEGAVRYIEQNCLKADFDLSLAAEKAFISEVYFRKLFREKFGMAPKQYVLRYRIGHAASLILSGYFSLQEISARCGFRDYKHFTVQFKKIIGVSPSCYGYEYGAKCKRSEPSLMQVPAPFPSQNDDFGE